MPGFLNNSYGRLHACVDLRIVRENYPALESYVFQLGVHILRMRALNIGMDNAIDV
jgi:hypothetical protein